MEVKCDKVTHHGYHRFYPLFLERFREQECSIFEIGFGKGKSLQLWREYLPKSTITFLEKEQPEEAEISREKANIIVGDQSNAKTLSELVRKIGSADIIIDDGSHAPEHQLLAFDTLFSNLLNNDGVYIIEDIETSYWKNGICYENKIEKGYKHPESTVEIFKQIVDVVNKEFIKDESLLEKMSVSLSTLTQISMISFQYNTIIITKKGLENKAYEDRQYRFSKNL